jgi:hypothetical protein
MGQAHPNKAKPRPISWHVAQAKENGEGNYHSLGPRRVFLTTSPFFGYT